MNLTRREQNKLADAMRYAPDRLKREILGRNRNAFIQTFTDAFTATDGKGDPVWSARMAACEMYARIEGMLGPTHQVLIGILGELGVSTRDELNELVESGRALKRSEQDVSKTVGDIADETIQLLSDCIRRDPTIAARARAAIDTVAPGVRDGGMAQSELGGKTSTNGTGIEAPE